MATAFLTICKLMYAFADVCPMGSTSAGRQLFYDGEIDSGDFTVALFLKVKCYLLPFIQSIQTGILDSGDVNEHIIARIIGIDETISLLRVKPLYSAL